MSGIPLHIQVELKVIEVHAPAVARATKQPVTHIIGGLSLLWHRCWSTKSDTITRIGLAGIFGPDGLDEVIAALVDSLFLEATDGGWRIRGAEKYLRIANGRSKGGHAAKSNLIPGARHSSRLKGVQPRASREPAESQPRESLGTSSALTPNTEHRTPKEASAPPAPKLPKVAPPNPRPRDSDELLADFKAVTGTDYLWQGAKDGTALAELRKAFSLEEIRARWRKGLAAPATDWASCRTVSQLRLKWNDLAASKAPFVSIEHQPSRIF